MANIEYTAEQLIVKMPDAFEPDQAVGVNVTYLFEHTGPGGGTWWVKVADGQATSGSGQIEHPTIKIKASAQDYVKIARRQMNPATAFMMGKLKVSGDMSLALKLQSMFKPLD